jgi:large subunit ribosomal protein L3
MIKRILGYKVGMTQIFTAEGKCIPVTAIKAGPCVVVQKKTESIDGYSAIQVGFGEIKESKVTKPVKGHFVKSNLKPFKYLREFRGANVDVYQVGQEIRADVFGAGERVDVTAVSRGKGFAGGIKRHGFHRGPMKHGSKYHRRPGTAGAKGPARVFKGHKMPGRLGGVPVTVQNLQVVQTDINRNLILVKGAVPGPINGLVSIKSTVKS